MPPEERKLSDGQREMVGRLFDRCCEIVEKYDEFVSAGSKYPTSAEMGELQAVQEEIRSEIDNLFDLLLEDIITALNQYRLHPRSIVILRDRVIPEALADLFPKLSVNGVPV